MRSLKYTKPLILTSMLLITNPAMAALHLGLSGYWAKNHVGLQETVSMATSGSLALDMGPFLRVGYTYKQQSQTAEGYTRDAASMSYIYYQQEIIKTKHSADLFAILYPSATITPFVFIGWALMYFDVKYQVDDYPELSDSYGPEYSPNLGAGVAFSLTQAFSFKITGTWSHGKKRSILTNEDVKTIDPQYDLGISYKLF